MKLRVGVRPAIDRRVPLACASSISPTCLLPTCREIRRLREPPRHRVASCAREGTAPAYGRDRGRHIASGLRSAAARTIGIGGGQPGRAQRVRLDELAVAGAAAGLEADERSGSARTPTGSRASRRSRRRSPCGGPPRSWPCRRRSRRRAGLAWPAVCRAVAVCAWIDPCMCAVPCRRGTGEWPAERIGVRSAARGNRPREIFADATSSACRSPSPAPPHRGRYGPCW